MTDGDGFDAVKDARAKRQKQRICMLIYRVLGNKYYALFVKEICNTFEHFGLFFFKRFSSLAAFFPVFP